MTPGLLVIFEQGGGDEQVLNNGTKIGERNGDPQQEAKAGHEINLGHRGHRVPAVSEPEPGAVHEQAGGQLGLTVAPVVAAAGHPVVPEHQEHRVPGQQPHCLLYHGVHLTQLPSHLWVMRPELVASVIYT